MALQKEQNTSNCEIPESGRLENTHFQEFGNLAVKIQKFKMVDIRFDNPELAKMSLEINRLASFKNWPFQDEGRTDICTAEKVICTTVPI